MSDGSPYLIDGKPFTPARLQSAFPAPMQSTEATIMVDEFEYSFASLSQSGFILLQCPHHGAKNLTKTVLPKVASSHAADEISCFGGPRPMRPHGNGAPNTYRSTPIMNTPNEMKMVQSRHIPSPPPDSGGGAFTLAALPLAAADDPVALLGAVAGSSATTSFSAAGSSSPAGSFSSSVFVASSSADAIALGGTVQPLRRRCLFVP
mmetsp:Transcript_32092/g.81046  ORF Transcript_32092/g.81046 Transcript_32092/m.81046 type:complete len:206 (-) Transcript_32092:6-623(-)